MLKQESVKHKLLTQSWTEISLGTVAVTGPLTGDKRAHPNLEIPPQT